MGELSTWLPKVARRFVAEIIFGIQTRGCVRLTKVGRALGEKVSLKKTEERLCRQLGRQRLDRQIQDRLIRHAAPRIEDDTLLVLDLSDLTKKYAERMEYLARVRDGSEKELGWGYWTLSIIGANTKALMVLVTTAAYFAAVYLDLKLRLPAGHVGGSKKGTDFGQGGVGRGIEFRLFFGQPGTMVFIVQAREAEGAQEMQVLRSVLQARSSGRPEAEGLPEGGLPEGPETPGATPLD